MVDIEENRKILPSDGVRKSINMKQQEDFTMQVSKLFMKLPEEYVCTPDGLEPDDVTGELLLACPNFADPSMPSCICRIDKDRNIRKWFDMPLNPETNEVTLGDNADLFKTKVISKDNFFVATGENCVKEEIDVLAKIRYAAKPSKAVLKQLDDRRILAVFDEPQRAATPGQSIVFYQDDVVIGGGIID